MKKSPLVTTLEWICILCLGGCSIPAKMSPIPVHRPNFSKILEKEYLKLSDKSNNDYNNEIQANHFSLKAAQALSDEGVSPEYPMDWNFPNSIIAEMNEYRERLMNAFHNGGKSVSPRLAAEAQVSFDCWIEEVEEGKALTKQEICKNIFLNKLVSLEEAMQVRSPLYVIWFNRNSSYLTPAALNEINLIIQAANYRPNHVINIQGLTDGSGGRKFNLKLSNDRAECIKNAIINGGIHANRIATSLGKGEAEGTRDIDPYNRRVEIQLINKDTY